MPFFYMLSQKVNFNKCYEEIRKAERIELSGDLFPSYRHTGGKILVK